MSHVDLLVSEYTSDFEHSIQTSDNEFLEVELRCDTHEKVELEIVVVSDEWLGGSSTSDHGHHWGFDLSSAYSSKPGRLAHLHETEVVEEFPDIVDDLGSSDEDVPSLVVHDQIQISLPVPSF